MTNQELLEVYKIFRDDANRLALKHAKISFNYCEDVKRFDKLIREIKCTIAREEKL